MEPGTRLGPYEIQELLGSGGMGAVYLAHDTRLGRRVAIKVLPPEYAGDPERLARFEKEARAAAALNHPHIAVLHDVGSEGPQRYIVQEHLEGKPLAAALEKGPLPLDKALDLGVEIAQGLAAAHEVGVVHRDLKPDNLFVTREGHAKILDFGLAKLTEQGAAMLDGQASHSPTQLGTVAGQVMGTAGYMAPEQIEAADEVDSRADVFAFGVVLYEMVTGRRAFAGSSVLDTLHAITRRDPAPIGSVDPSLPAELARILDKAMTKDRGRRYQRAEEMAIDLRRLRDDVVAGRTVAVGLPGVSPDRSARADAAPAVAQGAIAAIALMALIAGVALGRLWWGAPAALPQLDLFLTPDEVSSTMTQPLAISSDGAAIALIDDGGLRYRRLAERSWTEVGEASGVVFFAPDGQTLYFTRQGEIWSVGLDGSAPRLVVETEVQFVLFGWNGEAGKLLFSGSTGNPEVRTLLVEVDPEQGEAIEIWTAGGEQGVLPAGALGERRVVALQAAPRGIDGIAVLDLDTGRVGRWRAGFGTARVTDAGRIHAVDMQGNLMRVSLTTAGDSFATDTVQVIGGVRTWNGVAAFDVAANGTVVALAGESVDTEMIQQLAWFEPNEPAVAASRQAGIYSRESRLSPDGSTLAFVATNLDAQGPLLHDLERDAVTPLAADHPGGFPVWSPDGREVLHHVVRTPDGSAGMYRSPIDRSSPPALVLADPEGEYLLPMDWHGDTLLYARSASRTGTSASDLWTLSLADGASKPFVATAANESHGRFSTDGTWVAYVSDHSGVANVYVRPAAGGGEITVSSGDGSAPYWHPQRSRLFFLAGPENERSVYAVDIDRGTASTVRLVTPLPPGTASSDIDLLIVAPDGQRFLTAVFLSEPPPAQVRIVLNQDAR